MLPPFSFRVAFRVQSPPRVKGQKIGPPCMALNESTSPLFSLPLPRRLLCPLFREPSQAVRLGCWAIPGQGGVVATWTPKGVARVETGTWWRVQCTPLVLPLPQDCFENSP